MVTHLEGCGSHDLRIVTMLTGRHREETETMVKRRTGIGQVDESLRCFRHSWNILQSNKELGHRVYLL